MNEEAPFLCSDGAIFSTENMFPLPRFHQPLPNEFGASIYQPCQELKKKSHMQGIPRIRVNQVIAVRISQCVFTLSSAFSFALPLVVRIKIQILVPPH
jgi:hypothetical protein